MVKLFGIGGKAWQKKVGMSVNARGVPIPSHGPSKRKVKVIPVSTIKFEVAGSGLRGGQKRDRRGRFA
jgi:hypothetical protein